MDYISVRLSVLFVDTVALAHNHLYVTTSSRNNSCFAFGWVVTRYVTAAP